ncbi:hypothetical protein ACRBEV_01420 [Methylobacterium phyllosphaerae]
MRHTAGHTRNAVVDDGAIDPGTILQPKPFGTDPLADEALAVRHG